MFARDNSKATAFRANMKKALRSYKFIGSDDEPVLDVRDPEKWALSNPSGVPAVFIIRVDGDDTVETNDIDGFAYAYITYLPENTMHVLSKLVDQPKPPAPPGPLKPPVPVVIFDYDPGEASPEDITLSSGDGVVRCLYLRVERAVQWSKVFEFLHNHPTAGWELEAKTKTKKPAGSRAMDSTDPGDNADETAASESLGGKEWETPRPLRRLRRGAVAEPEE